MKKMFLYLTLVLVSAVYGLVTTSDATVLGKDLAGYYTATDSNSPAPSTTFLWVDATQSGTIYTVADDDYVNVSNTSTNIFGNNYTQSRVHDNGLIVPFVGNQINYSPYNNTDLPNKDLANNNTAFIAPFWDDLTPKATSRIYRWNTAYQGSNVSVIEWYDFAHYDDPTASITFEVILYNGVNRIKFQYQYLTSTAGFANGSSATIGIQGLGALNNNYFYQYSFNTASLSNGLAIEFDQDNDVDWLSNGLEAASIANGGYATNQNVADTDGGGVTDGAEIRVGTDPNAAADDASADGDSDGLTNQFETLIGTNPSAVDTEGDGLKDGDEVNTFGTNPLLVDTDNDGLNDGQEVGFDGVLTSISNTNLTAPVLKGDASIQVVDTSEFPTSGSAVISGNDTFTYTGKDATHFFGIPATGANAVFAHGCCPAVEGDTDPLDQETDGDGWDDGLEVQLGSDPRNNYSLPGTLVSNHVSTQNDYTRPNIVVDRNKNLHVTYYDWESWDKIYYTMLDPSGNVVIPQMGVKTEDAYNSSSPEILITNDNKVVIVYQTTRENDWDSWDLGFIKLQPNASAGTATVLEHKKIAFGQYRHPAIGKDSAGNIHIAYQSLGQWNVDLKGVGYVKINPNGDILAGPKELYRFEGDFNHYELRPHLVVDSRNHVNVTWRYENRNDSIGYEVYYTRLDSNGKTLIEAGPLGFAAGRPRMAAWRDKIYLTATKCIDGSSDDGLYFAIIDGSQPTVKFTLPFTRVVDSHGEWIIKPDIAVDPHGNAHIAYTIDDQHEYLTVDKEGTVIQGPTYVDPEDYYWIGIGVSGQNVFLAYAESVAIEESCCGWGIYYRSFATANTSAPGGGDGGCGCYISPAGSGSNALGGAFLMISVFIGTIAIRKRLRKRSA